jgi:fructose-1-phosphate kinase PfkB-like protein
VLVTYEHGCFASIRGERGQPHRYRAESPHLEAVSRAGAGAALLAGFIAAWLEDATPEIALRKAVAAGAASTLELGAGQFDPRDVGRILPDVRVDELASATAH